MSVQPLSISDKCNRGRGSTEFGRLCQGGLAIVVGVDKGAGVLLFCVDVIYVWSLTLLNQMNSGERGKVYYFLGF